MVVVAVIAILAVVVVPSWMKQASQAKGTSEVTALFNEIASKEQRYYSDNNAYVDTTGTPCPGSPSSSQQDASCFLASPWSTLSIAPPESAKVSGSYVPVARCSYKVKTGLSTANPNTGLPSPFTLPTSPATSWYWIYAKCDMDGNGTYSQYLQSSLDSTIQKDKEGE
jgi:type II secretory pathway pseudopilin PulG